MEQLVYMLPGNFSLFQNTSGLIFWVSYIYVYNRKTLQLAKKKFNQKIKLIFFFKDSSYVEWRVNLLEQICAGDHEESGVLCSYWNLIFLVCSRNIKNAVNTVTKSELKPYTKRKKTRKHERRDPIFIGICKNRNSANYKEIH